MDFMDWVTSPENIEAFNLESTGRIHAVNYESKSAGPGERTELFLQGCIRACPGCFSVETWDRAGGDVMTVRDVLEILYPADKITICGGEPLLQSLFLFRVLFALRELYTDLGLDQPTVLLYTGNTVLQLMAMPSSWEVVELCDLLVTGSYVQEKNCMSRETDFIGSYNQRLSILRDGDPAVTFTAAEANNLVADERLANTIDSMARIIRNSR